MEKHLFLILIIFVTSGCTSLQKGDKYGVEIWEHFTDISSEKVNRLAQEHCQMYGKQAQLENRKPRALLVSEYDEYQFRCVDKTATPNPIFQPPMPSRNEHQVPSQSTRMTIESASKKCEEIGFKLGTDAFGNCVLKLSK